MYSLSGKNILLGVTGGIAAYKSADLVRRLVEAGAVVQVVMTDGAQRFITPLTMQAVSGRAVRTSLWDESAELGMGHIELARWADLILIAPATADCIARLAEGRADDLLTTLCLASEAPLMLAPAMNHVMWNKPATQENCDKLRERGVTLIGPATGELAEREIGPGRMLEPLEIRERVFVHFGGGTLAGVKILITAGPTREPLDPVRFLSNRSTGRMGYAVAEACRVAGAEVTLVTGPTELKPPAGVECVAVESAGEMHKAVQDRIAGQDIFIAAAAVADYRPVAASRDKIKKQTKGMQLDLARTQDILAEVAAEHPAVFTLGFAAETAALEKHAREKLAAKGLDMIAGNLVGDGRGFAEVNSSLHVFWRGGDEALPEGSKPALAKALVELLARRYNENKPENKGAQGDARSATQDS